MRVGMRLGPFYVSTSTRSRRRRSASRLRSQSGLQGTGRVMLSDGRLVAFKCGHHHRSQSAALECADKRIKQLQRGQNLHLITRVLETPQSRELTRQREAQRQAKRNAQADAAQRLARERADRQQARRQAADSRRQESALKRAEAKQAAAARRKESGRQRHERRQSTSVNAPEVTPPYRERRARRQNGSSADHARHHGSVETAIRRGASSRLVKITYLAGLLFIVGIGLVAGAGNHAKSGLATSGASVLMISVLLGVGCGITATARWLKRAGTNRRASLRH
jgi:hypothetical protein